MSRLEMRYFNNAILLHKNIYLFGEEEVTMPLSSTVRVKIDGCSDTPRSKLFREATQDRNVFFPPPQGAISTVSPGAQTA